MLPYPLIIGLILLTVLYLIVMVILWVRYRHAMRQLEEKLRECKAAEQQKKAANNAALSKDHAEQLETSSDFYGQT